MGVARTLPDLHDLGVSAGTLWALLLCCADSLWKCQIQPCWEALPLLGGAGSQGCLAVEAWNRLDITASPLVGEAGFP